MIPWWLDSAESARRMAQHLVTRDDKEPSSQSKIPSAEQLSSREAAQKLQRLITRLDRHFKWLVQQVPSAGGSFGHIGDRLHVSLLDGHMNAYMIGAAHGGTAIDPGNVDDRRRLWEVAHAVSDLESYYLQGFVNDLEAGDPRYFDESGNPKADVIHRRMRMYMGRMNGTAEGGFVDGSPEDATFNWRLGAPETGHCEDCPIFAEGSPYPKGNLPAVPRDNSTPCLFNCTCHLERGDGEFGFGPAASLPPYDEVEADGEDLWSAPADAGAPDDQLAQITIGADEYVTIPTH